MKNSVLTAMVLAVGLLAANASWAGRATKFTEKLVDSESITLEKDASKADASKYKLGEWVKSENNSAWYARNYYFNSYTFYWQPTRFYYTYTNYYPVPYVYYYQPRVYYTYYTYNPYPYYVVMY